MDKVVTPVEKISTLKVLVVLLGFVFIASGVYWGLINMNFSLMEFVFIVIFPLIFIVVLPIVAFLMFLEQ